MHEIDTYIRMYIPVSCIYIVAIYIYILVLYTVECIIACTNTFPLSPYVQEEGKKEWISVE